jgi:primosomal protein N' (replication factor Y)
VTRYAELAVTLPVPGRFHYEVPEGLRGTLALGHRVLVPFGRRRVTGFVVGLSDELAPELAERVRPIEARLDEEPLLPADVLALATFCADYYLAAPGEVLKLALPPGLTAASVDSWTLTAAGRAFLEAPRGSLPGGERCTEQHLALLEAAKKRGGVRTHKVSARLAETLAAGGLIERRERLDARASEAQVELVVRAVEPREAWPRLKRSRARLALWERLAEGPVEVQALLESSALGDPRAALRALEKEGLVRRERVRREQAHEGAHASGRAQEASLPLTPEQASALAALTAALEAQSGAAFLLHGVTGSGKTEVYLQLIAHARARGLGALVLVPEIALTPQLESRFRARFGADVVVLHSAIPDAERRRRWLRLRAGEARIALGARSALWAPVSNLGVVVVDEEHDPSFKQGSDVRYHGRDLAIARAHRTQSVLLLGSATPSMETLQHVRTRRLVELRLAARVGDRPMPTVEVVDLAAEKRAMKGDQRLFSRALADRLREVVQRREQAIIFLNRRGFNTVVFCEACGDARSCPSCDVALTHHLAQRTLACHHCGHQERFDAPCKKCKGTAMSPFGAGTERVEQEVLAEVPDARVLRLDRDVTARAGMLEETLAAFRAQEADVLVGTQMVAKGHDFPKVTLVGILLADASLSIPDFRAAERTFQLLTQVAGRAGRAEAPGHVVIQTFQPGHYALTSALAHDADRFFELEAAARKSAGYPPFARIGLVRVEAGDQERARGAARLVAERLMRAAAGHEARVLGPSPAPIEKLRDRFRQQLLVFAPTPAKLNAVLARVRSELAEAPVRADVVFDVDPLELS